MEDVKMKTYRVVFDIRNVTYIRAYNEDDAKEQFEAGDWEAEDNGLWDEPNLQAIEIVEE